MNKVAPTDYQSSAMAIVNVPDLLTTQNGALHNQSRTCKICLEEESSALDALLLANKEEGGGSKLMVPCECSGSVGYVHQKCIKTWIYKQIENTGKKQAFCQICKSQIYFKMKKNKYCEFKCHHLSLISGCNILSALIEVFLLVVKIMIFRYSLGLSDSILLRYVLIVLIGIVSLALGFTLILMANEAFVRTKKEIGHIFSVQEAEQLGLREVRIKTAVQFVKSSFALPQRHPIRMQGNRNPASNTNHLARRRRTSNFNLIELNFDNPLANP